MSKTLKHELKADFLLEKGIEILWSKGYNATSVNDIVKAADIPKGSFYFYFDSKEDFTVKAIEKYFDENCILITEILENVDLSPKQRLFSLYDFRSNMIKDELNCKMGCLASNLGNEMSEHNEKIRKVIIDKEQSILETITNIIKEAQDLGEIKSKMKASDLAAFIEDAGKGAMVSMKEMQSAYPIDNFIKMVKTILLV